MRPTSYDAAALERLRREVAPHWKGAPLGAPVELEGFAGMDALGLPLPLLLLRERAVAHNIARMARYAAEEGALLAPHAKTTMSPELIARQVEAGAWALTVATPAQAAALRRLGVQRLVLANQLVERSAIAWVAAEQRRDPAFELLCLVDSAGGVALLDRELAAAGAPRPVSVLLEVGIARGRSGVRAASEAGEVAQAVRAAAGLELAGVECFEGLVMDPARLSDSLAAVDAHLDRVAAIAEELGTRFVSAGGSAFFDRVLARFPRPEWTVVLRSGCYVSQDGGIYDRISPLAGRGDDPEPLQDALELWGAVLSRPEPDLAVVGAGRRDAPYDISLPRPVAWRSADGTRAGDLDGASVLRLNDQHATIALPGNGGPSTPPTAPSRRPTSTPPAAAGSGQPAPGAPAVGDLVRFTVSHPCGAFDRWRVIPLVDDDRRVTGAVHTIF